MRSIWKGSISFGLVTIPVKLYSATEAKDVSFHQVRRSDGKTMPISNFGYVDDNEPILDTLTAGKLAFVNLSRRVLLTDAATLIPPAGIVLELLEDIPADGEVLKL